MASEALADLAAVSRFAAGDLLLTQGAGGNTSVKTAGGARLLIKASGLRLADVTEDAGYLELDLPALAAIMDDPALADLEPAAAHDLTARRMRELVASPDGPRPSMETGFHLLLERVVLHTHPVYVNAFTCSEGGREALEEAADGPLVWVPYAAPGYPLAKAVAERCVEYRGRHGEPPRRIVLESHGLIATAETAGRTLRDTRALAEIGKRAFGALDPGACGTTEPSAATRRWARRLGGALSAAGHAGGARAARRRAIVDAARGPEPLTRGPLVPDDVVYGVHNFWRLDPGDAPEDWLASADGAVPDKAVLELAGEGAVLVGPSERTLDYMEENLLANVLIHRLVARRGRPRHLGSREVDEILAMESEQYRQALAERGSRAPLAGGG